MADEIRESLLWSETLLPIEKMEEMRLAAIAVIAVRNQRDKVKNSVQASRRELGVLSMLASCAPPLSEDGHDTGLRRSRFKVGHAAACQDALSFQVLHVCSEMEGGCSRV